MRTAILSALLAAATLSSAGQKPKLADPAAIQQPPQKTDPPPDSPRTGASPAAPADPSGKPATSTAPDTDPLKMAAPAVKMDGSAQAPDKSYVIGAEDVLSILVWNSTPLSGNQTVRPDGRISMPLIGEIVAAGKTPLELTNEIAERLKSGNIIKTPDVAIGVVQVNSKKYFIQGEVNRPGVYNLIVPTTVLEALVNAGTFREFAKTTRIRVMRGSKTFMFNYKQVIKNQHPEQNIQLQPGDQIIVP